MSSIAPESPELAQSIKRAMPSPHSRLRRMRIFLGQRRSSRYLRAFPRISAVVGVVCSSPASSHCLYLAPDATALENSLGCSSGHISSNILLSLNSKQEAAAGSAPHPGTSTEAMIGIRLRV
uniref:Uncharacterized protein n=1 Tax=Rousettus aegyptiacus TaxID=9407 RepID=A0A7J8F0T9_ROUAE|nr:hypothetical protein HJG63_012248 [Rousettus aegyptiacus]